MISPIPTDSAEFLAWRREHFPFFNHKICLTHASVSPLPAASADAIASYAQNLAWEGQFEYLHDHIYARCKERLAKLVGHGAQPREISFAGSTSHALGLVATSFPWQSGENCIVADGDFPANVMVWKNLHLTHGVECKMIPYRLGMELSIDDVLPLIDDKTRLVSLSAVNFLAGSALNLREIGAELHRRGIKFCVDAIQALGAIRLDLSEVDFVCADAHKWLMGPNGAAFLWTRGEVLPQMRPQIFGWLASANRDNWFSYDLTPHPTAERFEPGARNYLGIIGMEASLAVLEAIGIETIEKRVVELRDYGAKKLAAVGCELLWTPKLEQKSGIFSFQMPGVDLVALNKKLDEKFALSMRKGYDGGDLIRVSPHFVNCEGDLDELASAISEF
jgi:selenocysteine lyase/cysteine desulfurase